MSSELIAHSSPRNNFLIRSFIIVRLGKRLTSFTKDNSANFSGEKW